MKRAATEDHARAWRDVAAVASQWGGAATVSPSLLDFRTRGPWWDLLRESRTTLLVSREYEHLVVALRSAPSGPEVSFVPLPHPSGIAVDAARGVVHIASTRNPNQVFTFRPVERVHVREGIDPGLARRRPLMPSASTFFPGSLYLHDLAVIGGELHGTATGENAVVRLGAAGEVARVWWPRCIEQDGKPVFDRNHVQLNAIAAGPTVGQSYFAASSTEVARRRPGHRNYPVDGRGVILSGATREPVAAGLTRPHSLRSWRGRLWVANSGYGEFGRIGGHRFEPLVKLPGWTRGVCLAGGLAFVGTSRIIPRFRSYAPGVDLDRSICGVHAVDIRSGAVVASIVWPAGNQIFAIERVANSFAGGFAMLMRRARSRERDLFYAFAPPRRAGGRRSG